MILTICCVVAMGIHVGSSHIDPDRHFSNDNKGIYWKLDNKYVVGTYANSIGRQSTYVVKEFRHSKYFSVGIGAVSGYNNSVIPMVVPTFSVTNNVKVSYIPKTNLSGAHVVHVMYEVKL